MCVYAQCFQGQTVVSSGLKKVHSSNTFVKGRRPQIFLKMEEDLKCVFKWKTTSNIFVKGRRP
jgi:hypothetical protein